ncbi:MAG: hypothetical protein ACPGQS_07895 [Bradymonadia bacterium]
MNLMRLCLLLICLPSLVSAAPIAGLKPTPHYHIDVAGNLQLNVDAPRLLTVGRLGMSDRLDAGLALGFLAGDITGMTIGVPARYLWLQQSQTKEIARITSDMWFAITQASPVMLTELRGTVSAAHERNLIGPQSPTELRITVGASMLNIDADALNDNLQFHLVALGGFGVHLLKEWICSIEAGLIGEAGVVNLEASYQF